MTELASESSVSRREELLEEMLLEYIERFGLIGNARLYLNEAFQGADFGHQKDNSDRCGAVAGPAKLGREYQKGIGNS